MIEVKFPIRSKEEKRYDTDLQRRLDEAIEEIKDHQSQVLLGQTHYDVCLAILEKHLGGEKISKDRKCNECIHQGITHDSNGKVILACDRFDCKFEPKIDELLEKAYKAGWRDSHIKYDFKGAKERNFED